MANGTGFKIFKPGRLKCVQSRAYIRRIHRKEPMNVYRIARIHILFNYIGMYIHLFVEDFINMRNMGAMRNLFAVVITRIVHTFRNCNLGHISNNSN